MNSVLFFCSKRQLSVSFYSWQRWLELSQLGWKRHLEKYSIVLYLPWSIQWKWETILELSLSMDLIGHWGHRMKSRRGWTLQKRDHVAFTFAQIGLASFFVSEMSQTEIDGTVPGNFSSFWMNENPWIKWKELSAYHPSWDNSTSGGASFVRWLPARFGVVTIYSNAN